MSSVTVIVMFSINFGSNAPITSALLTRRRAQKFRNTESKPCEICLVAVGDKLDSKVIESVTNKRAMWNKKCAEKKHLVESSLIHVERLIQKAVYNVFSVFSDILILIFLSIITTFFIHNFLCAFGSVLSPPNGGCEHVFFLDPRTREILVLT